MSDIWVGLVGWNDHEMSYYGYARQKYQPDPDDTSWCRVEFSPNTDSHGLMVYSAFFSSSATGERGKIIPLERFRVEPGNSPTVFFHTGRLSDV